MRIKTVTYSDLRQKPCQFYWHGLLQIAIERSAEEAKVYPHLTRANTTVITILSYFTRLFSLFLLLLSWNVSPSTAEAFLVCTEPNLQNGISIEGRSLLRGSLYSDQTDALSVAMSLIARARPRIDTDRIIQRMRFIDAPSPNAYASPSGEVILTNSLLAAITDPAQLSFVVAHEVGHILNGDNNTSSSLASELAADDFAVAVLTQAGITQCAGVSALLALGDHRASSHPSLQPRLRALLTKSPLCAALKMSTAQRPNMEG